jgi:multidrug efflux pump
LRTFARQSHRPTPKGTIDDGDRRYQIYANDQANKAADYTPLIIAYRNGAAVRLSDVAEVRDSVQDVRNLGMFNGRPSVLLILYRQPSANIVETVDRIRPSYHIWKLPYRPK